MTAGHREELAEEAQQFPGGRVQGQLLRFAQVRHQRGLAASNGFEDESAGRRFAEGWVVIKLANNLTANQP